MKVTIFSHESDIDGVFSAAIGLIRYPQARTVFLGYGTENFTKCEILFIRQPILIRKKAFLLSQTLDLTIT